MSQDLLKISQEAFALQIHRLPSKTLVNLLKDLYQFKWEYGKYFTDEKIIDIERKESKILFELQNRGYKKKSDNADYNSFIKSLNKKKRVF